MLTNTKKRKHKGNTSNILTKNFVVIDIETTGFSPHHDEIIEVAAIKIKNGQKIDTYTTLIKPKNSVPSFITHLTGISNEDLVNAPSFEDIAETFYNFISDEIIIGHNVHFDINFLYDNFLNALNEPLKNDFIDTMNLAKKVYSLKNYKLKTVCEHLNINYSNGHRALSDCEYTNSIYNYISEYLIKNDLELSDLSYKYNAMDLLSLKPTIDPTIDNELIAGQTFNFIGRFKKINKHIGVQAILNNGGKFNFIKTKVDYLVVGKDPIELTLEKYKKLGTAKIINETEFLSLFDDEFFKTIPLKKHIKSDNKITNLSPVNNEIKENENITNYNFVFTGTLQNFTRNEAHQHVINYGGFYKNAVTSKTNYLVLGNLDYASNLKAENKSSKVIKAEELILKGQNLKIIDEVTFLDLFETK